MRYLLDTNVVSEVTRPNPDPAVVDRLAEAEGVAALAAVTWHELRYGLARLPAGRRRDGLEAFLLSLPVRYPVLPYDRDAALWHAQERVRLEASGVAPPFADGQIAAIAATRGLSLVTRNVADFRHFLGIGVEIWWSAPA